jgi:carbon-monoxide dehydrogenase small subunit
MKISFILNKKNVEVDVSPSMRLLDVVRDVLGLTGTKEGCGEGECGACTVLVNDEPYNSCLTPIINVANKEVMTIEGFRETKSYRVIADAFASQGGSQCGFCTPGMILATYAVLKKNPHPSEEEARLALSGNLCRCTGYQAIVDAVMLAAKKGIEL